MEITDKELKEKNKEYTKTILKLLEDEPSLFDSYNSTLYKIKNIKTDIIEKRRGKKLHHTF